MPPNEVLLRPGQLCPCDGIYEWVNRRSGRGIGIRRKVHAGDPMPPTHVPGFGSRLIQELATEPPPPPLPCHAASVSAASPGPRSRSDTTNRLHPALTSSANRSDLDRPTISAWTPNRFASSAGS